MKLIEAIIKPFRLEAVKEALAKVGVEVMTVSEVRQWANHSGPEVNYRGSNFTLDFLPQVKVEFLIESGLFQGVITALRNAAKTGGAADGKIMVTEIEDVVLI